MIRRATLILLSLALACGDDDGTTDDLPTEDGGANDGSMPDTDGFMPDTDGFVPDTDAFTPDGDGSVPDTDAFMPEDMGVDMGEPCDPPGALETVSCGMCGTAERFCTAAGIWEMGICEDEGVCMPGTTQDIDCGMCGSQAQRCTTACVWENMGSCSSEGECAPGETTRTGDGCPADETRELTCNASCTFEAGACEPDPCTTPGAIEDVDCGLCGTRERFCTAGGVWTYGACEDEGVCMPGTLSSIACGMCGMQSARCTDACQWDPTEACMAEGTCSPGEQTRTAAGCPSGQTRVLECDASCGYSIEVEACSDILPVDVLFLLDTTGSNQSAITGNASTIRSRCVDPILALTDAHVGLAFYGDHGTFAEPFEAQVELNTGTAAAIGSAMTTAPLLGGADDSTLTALDILAGGTPPASATPFTCSAGRVDGGCWRSLAQRVVVVFTDEGAKSGPDPAGAGLYSPWPAATSPDWTTVAPALMSDGTRLFVALDDSSITPAGQYEEMVTDLGGDASDVYKGAGMHGAHCDAIVAKIEALAGF
jgi:hypothetical protein